MQRHHLTFKQMYIKIDSGLEEVEVAAISRIVSAKKMYCQKQV